MVRERIRIRWLGVLTALMVALFAFSPIAEAAECGVELPASHSSIGFDSETHHGSDEQPLHGGCAHGHCHHAPTVAPTHSLDEAVNLSARMEHAFPLDDLRLSSAPGGLERPPRD